jgi:hypothetical protein
MMPATALGSETMIKTAKMLAMASMLALGACATGPTVRAMSDSSVNFSQYKTFAFIEPLATDKNGYETVVSSTLKAATTRELQARGLTYDPTNPQLLVNFSAKLSKQLQTQQTPVGGPVGPGWGYGWGGGYYGYRTGLYSAWPMYTQTTVTEYTEGTLNIDVADSLRKMLVWEGVVSQALTKDDYKNPAATLDAAVAAAFAKFPVQPPKK